METVLSSFSQKFKEIFKKLSIENWQMNEEMKEPISTISPDICVIGLLLKDRILFPASKYFSESLLILTTTGVFHIFVVMLLHMLLSVYAAEPEKQGDAFFIRFKRN